MPDRKRFGFDAICVFALQVWTKPTRRLAMPTSQSLVAPTAGHFNAVSFPQEKAPLDRKLPRQADISKLEHQAAC